MTEAVLPPLMSGLAVSGSIDPFVTACAKASLGCDAGLVVYNVSVDRLGSALVFAPEVPLAKAMAMLPLCGVGLQNSLGALAPPEVAVHLGWSGEIRVNGARCGRFRVAASTDDEGTQPDWMVVGFEMPLISARQMPGEDVEETVLYEEGCVDVDPVTLIESWARHTLNWIARWEDEGPRPLHAEWRGIAHGLGDAIRFGEASGTFLGIDEDFGMLLRDGSDTRLFPLTALLEPQ